MDGAGQVADFVLERFPDVDHEGLRILAQPPVEFLDTHLGHAGKARAHERLELGHARPAAVQCQRRCQQQGDEAPPGSGARGACRLHFPAAAPVASVDRAWPAGWPTIFISKGRSVSAPIVIVP